MIYKIEKPKIPLTYDNEFVELFSLYQQKADIAKLYQETLEPHYLYWDKIKYKSNLPSTSKKESFWNLVKFIRKTQSIETIISDESGKTFTWIRLPRLEEFLHRVDLNTGGNLFAFAGDIDDQTKYKFISRGVMEEAIASSQLEGAHTTREAAKKMLREGRKPRTTSEHMILNGYQTMQFIEANSKDAPLTLDTVFQLHVMLTKNTIPENEQGRFRQDSEPIVVGDDDGTVYHVPPKEAFVQKEMKRFISFANDELKEPFLHPLIKAIMLHFWIGYLHPFTDGNGRLARAMFYWYLLRKNYWAFAYLPISKVIKRSPLDYGMSYVYSEQDDCEMTYFIDYNLKKIRMAVAEFEDYLKVKAKENALMGVLSKSRYKFNNRQIQLLQYFYKNKDDRTTIITHLNTNQISRATAYADLLHLAKTGFLKQQKVGKTVYYHPTEKIISLFHK